MFKRYSIILFVIYINIFSLDLAKLQQSPIIRQISLYPAAKTFYGNEIASIEYWHQTGKYIGLKNIPQKGTPLSDEEAKKVYYQLKEQYDVQELAANEKCPK